MWGDKEEASLQCGAIQDQNDTSIKVARKQYYLGACLQGKFEFLFIDLISSKDPLV